MDDATRHLAKEQTDAATAAASKAASKAAATAATAAGAHAQAHVLGVERTPASSKSSMTPTTTEEQDLTSAGQRHINLIWETTQMRIALSVIWISLATAFLISIMGQFLRTAADLQLAAVVFMFGVANLVTGFYFGRTNHTKTGGVGPYEAGR